MLAAALGLALAGCGSSGKQAAKPKYAYPQNVKAQFLEACKVHSQQSVCECIIRAYEATMPYGIYHDISLGGVRLNNRAYFQAFTQASSHCS